MNDARDSVHLSQQQAHPLHPLLVVLRLEVVPQELQVAADGIERRPDLVGEAGGGLVHERQPIQPPCALLQGQQHGA